MVSKKMEFRRMGCCITLQYLDFGAVQIWLIVSGLGFSIAYRMKEEKEDTPGLR